MDPEILASQAQELAGQGLPVNATDALPTESDSNFFGSVVETASEFGSNVSSTFENVLQESQYGKFLRKIGLLDDAEPPAMDYEGASWAQDQNKQDWRVKLSLPPTYENSAVIEPLIETNGLIFPYTPTVTLQHSATYNQVKPIHSNYPFNAYQNSAVESIIITGDFFVETAFEAKYWIAAIHYLRSVTKMSYGVTPNLGSPPPIVRLSGYGDYVFNQIPVVVQSFSVDLQPDIDYIFCKDVGPSGTYVPTRSSIYTSLSPTYSRRSIQQFSLQDFVNGKYLGKGFI